MSESVIKDFDKILPPKRIAKLAGKEIDVSLIPSRVSLELAIFRDNVLKMKSSEEQQRKSLEIVAKVCQVKNPKITVDWLLDNTHYEQLIEFIDFVLEPLNRPGKGKKKVVK